MNRKHLMVDLFTALFVVALCWTQCLILLAQKTPDPSKVTSLTIREENSMLLKNLKEYPNLEVLSIICIESLQALP